MPAVKGQRLFASCMLDRVTHGALVGDKLQAVRAQGLVSFWQVAQTNE